MPSLCFFIIDWRDITVTGSLLEAEFLPYPTAELLTRLDKLFFLSLFLFAIEYSLTKWLTDCGFLKRGTILP